VKAHGRTVLVRKYLDASLCNLALQRVATRNAVVAVTLCDAGKVVSQVLFTMLAERLAQVADSNVF